MIDLIYLAILFLIIAIIAYALGGQGLAGFSMQIAKILVWIFVILFLLTLLLRLFT